VLASLALEDDEFARLMKTPSGKQEPAFRQRYIKEIIEIIRRNAADELDFLDFVATYKPFN
jgi:hypothetical protein